MSLKHIAILAITLIMLITSCTPSSDGILSHEEQTQELYDVSLTLSPADFIITSQEVDTRAVSSEIPTSLNRLTCSVFDAQDTEVATLSQKRESLGAGETFGAFTFQLPLGTYTFVAVLHEVDNTSLTPATITSPTLATLPSNSIQDTYCCTKSQDVSANSSVTLNLGTRINAKFQLETLDEVPAEVTSIAISVNSGASTSVPAQPTINPTTGLATADWKFVKNLNATPGEKFNRTFSVLLNDDTKDVAVKLTPQSASSTYPERVLSEVPLQRNHITHATGYLFKPKATAGFTIDTSLADDINFPF